MGDTPSTRHSLLVRLRDPSDGPAWAEFLEIYEPLVYRLAYRKGLQEADAADLAQEVFRAVAVAINRWDPAQSWGSFRGWLSTIARNLIVNLLIARKREVRGTGDTNFQTLLEQHPARDSEESRLYEAELRNRLFAWASDRVRDEFRPATWRAFWETGVEGREPKAVAEELGVTVGAVYIARSRVMARLKREVEGFREN